MLPTIKRSLRLAPSRDIAAKVRAEQLSYLSVAALEDLFDCVHALDAEKIPGAVVEAGCALGGSAIVMAAAKRRERELAVFDVFAMIPPPGERDGDDVHKRYESIASGASKGLGGNRYYGYEEDLVETVTQNFSKMGYPIAKHNVRLVKGYFQDTLAAESGPVALGHVDGDWYDSVMTCLVELSPRLSTGGRLVIDDYEHWSGCRTAVDEFLAAHEGVYEVERRTRPHLVRTSVPYPPAPR